MKDSDEENGEFSCPQDENGYESASEGNSRRKMDDSVTDGDITYKKQKMDFETNKNDRKKRDKKKDKDKHEDTNGLFGDGWLKNRIFKTFIMEPSDKKSEIIHIMEIAKILRNIKITYHELVKAGKNRFKITFDNPRHAEPLINSKILTENYKYKIYVPTMYKETIGVIRNVPPTILESELLTNLESNRIKITKIERIKKLHNKDLIPTYSIKIYAEGEKLPTQVKIYNLPYEVDCYIFPLKCCLKCVRYGHKTKACKSPKVRCYNCSNEDHEGQNCKSTHVSCLHCKEDHKAFDLQCRERCRQDNIRKAMAYNKLTFIEAAKQYPTQSQVQYRLQDNTEFPPLTQTVIQPDNKLNPDNTLKNSISNTTKVNKINKQNQINNEQLNTNDNQTSTEFITKIELEQIVNKLKIEIIKQLNITKLVNKIKQIQETITNNISTTNNANSKIDNHLLLININNQLNELVNPEILQNIKPPDNQT